MAGFELSSARGGPNLWTVLESAGFKGENAMKDFRVEMTNRGIPNDLGQKNSKALKELNKMAKIKYTPLPDELLKLEKEMGISKSKGQKLKLSQKLDDVQKWAHKTFGKKTTMPKLTGILNKLDDIPEIAKKGTGYLTKLGFKMLMPVGAAYSLLESKPLASGELTPEIIEEYKKGSMQQTMNRRGGGMMDINRITAPLGYALGGPAGMTDLERTGYDRSKSGTWNTNDLMRDIGGDISFATKRAGRGILDTVKGLFKEKQYEGGDNPYYMKFFDKYWKEGYGQEQIDMLWDIYKNDAGNFKEMKKSLVPSRTGDLTEPFTGAKGGLASISQMTRPVHMNSGGDPLKELLGQLRLQLMLEKGIEGSVLMPSGNPDKIKRLEKRIRQIETELGQ